MKNKAHINKVIRLTAGKLHSWCDTDYGIIKKENKNVPIRIWNDFVGIANTRLSLWQRLLLFFRKLLKI